MRAPMSVNSNDPSSTPVVQVKLPWTTILGATGTAAIFAAVMWASVQQLTVEVRELKTVVQSGNQLVITIQNDVNLLKYRQETYERRVEALAK